jgi:hypothetical protein
MGNAELKMFSYSPSKGSCGHFIRVKDFGKDLRAASRKA